MELIIFNNFRFESSKFLYITRELFPMLIRLKDALHYIMQILVLTLHPNLDMMQLFNHFLFLFKFPPGRTKYDKYVQGSTICKRFWTRMWSNRQKKSKEFLLLNNNARKLSTKILLIPPSANYRKRKEIEVG